MNFIYMLTGWEGSAYDFHVLCNALNQHDFDEPQSVNLKNSAIKTIHSATKNKN